MVGPHSYWEDRSVTKVPPIPKVPDDLTGYIDTTPRWLSWLKNFKLRRNKMPLYKAVVTGTPDPKKLEDVHTPGEVSDWFKQQADAKAWVTGVEVEDTHLTEITTREVFAIEATWREAFLAMVKGETEFDASSTLIYPPAVGEKTKVTI